MATTHPTRSPRTDQDPTTADALPALLRAIDVANDAGDEKLARELFDKVIDICVNHGGPMIVVPGRRGAVMGARLD